MIQAKTTSSSTPAAASSSPRKPSSSGVPVAVAVVRKGTNKVCLIYIHILKHLSIYSQKDSQRDDPRVPVKAARRLNVSEEPPVNDVYKFCVTLYAENK